MSNPVPETGGGSDRDQLISAMFASMVIQNANMAMIFLGQAPHPQTGETAQDLENAKYFIDQLEMIEAKTKGNLNKQEEMLLKQSLSNLRFGFVEAVEHPMTPAAAKKQVATEESPATSPETDEQETPIVEPMLPGESIPPSAAAAADPESRKKFTKKY